MPDADARWHRIQEIFFEATDLPPAQRESFVSLLCGADQAMATEVHSLLNADAREVRPVGYIIEQAADSLLDSELLGVRLGAYRILREIGRGGMATVFLAVRDDAQYEKSVAIKLVRRGMDTDDLLARFRAERQILANLDHPYCARLLDGGTAPDGRPFLVMEYVEGQRIDHYCRAHTLSIQERCELFLKICEAVAYAHRNNVIHRDIKPANILVGAEGIPKLLDFGVAKLLEAQDASGKTVTSSGCPPYTPDYGSPEQVQGLPVGPATDVYSLGAVLYQLLTETKPHNLDTYSPEEIHRVVCDAGIGAPSAARDIGKLGATWHRNLAGDLDAIVLTAMRKEPQRRYASVDALSDDIRRYLQGLPVRARRDSPWYRAGKFIRRYHAQSLAAAVLLLALAFGGFLWWRQSRHAQARRLYEDAREQMVQFREYSVDQAIAELQESIRLNPGYAPAHASLADAARLKGNYHPNDREPWNGLRYRAATEALRLDPANAEAHFTLGNLLFFYDWTWDRGEAEVRLAAQLRPRDVSYQVNLILALTILGRLDEALRVVDAAERLDPQRIDYQIQRALILLYQRRTPESIDAARRILQRDPNGVEGRWVLGMTLVQGGNYSEGIRVLESGLNKQHRDTRIEAALGNAYGLAGNRERAMAVLDLIEHPSTDVSIFVCDVCCALVYAGLGDPDGTMKWLETARGKHEASLPFVPVDPRYSRVAGDPRFREMMHWIRRGQPFSR
jgi:serine/threonine protein kinase